MLLNEWRSLGCAALFLPLLSCQSGPPTVAARGPESGQALAAALLVVQSAQGLAETIAARPPASCRQELRCKNDARTVVRTLQLERERSGTIASTREVRTWHRDSAGSVKLEVVLTLPAVAGGNPSRTLTLLRVDDDRFGALDGGFIQAGFAPLLDAALDADPAVEFDALIAAVGDTRCRAAPLVLPGSVTSKSVFYEANTRAVRADLALAPGGILHLEAEERTTCDASSISPPTAARPEHTGDELAALIRRGLDDGWLLPATSPPER